MLSLDVLPADILFLIVHSLSLLDVVSLSMVNKSLFALSEEHSYWLEPLRTARTLHPIPCATFDDLTVRTTKDLKQLVLHTVRLARAWRQPLPQISGPIQTFHCGAHNNILYCLPGTDAIVLYSFSQGTIICVDVKTGASSTPVFVGRRIFDISSPLEESTSFSVAVLVDSEEGISNMSIVVLRAAIHPAPAADVLLRRELDMGYVYTGIFMTSSVVGVARAAWGGTIEVLSFNLANPNISTIILTDRPRSSVLGSTVVGNTVFFIFPQGTDAFVYACPPRLLANSEPSPETDYTIQRSHIARIPCPPDFLPSPSDPAPPPPIIRLDYCVLSTEPNRGRNTISVARNLTTALSGGQTRPHSLEITFWPRPAASVPPSSGSPDPGSKADWERERAEARRMQPAQTISIPGSLSNQPGTAWELLVIANSGLAVVLVVDPPRDLDDEGDDPGLPPKLMMVRYDPVLHSVSLHELCIPAGTGEPDSDLQLDTRGICALAFDDHRGYVIVVTVHSVLHYIPYA
ncbi:hypothetical protein B0H12DRAFT_338570 [Mycena haematopus]|nr:hypothetical protein B0H12DRAFT_338570 [Mycena haematopus]